MISSEKLITLISISHFNTCMQKIIYIPVFSQDKMVRQCNGSIPEGMDFLLLFSVHIFSIDSRRSSVQENKVISYQYNYIT